MDIVEAIRMLLSLMVWILSCMHVILKRGEKTNEKNQINLIYVKLYVYVTLTVVSANSFSTGLS